MAGTGTGAGNVTIDVTGSGYYLVKDQNESGIFDINISYLLVKAALEETRKQAMIQKSRAFDYSRKNRNQSRQNIKEEIKKNKDSSQEPSQN